MKSFKDVDLVVAEVTDLATRAYALTHVNRATPVTYRDAVKVERLAAVAENRAATALLIELDDDPGDDHGVASEP